MRTIDQFDYDLWATEIEGKKQYFCRVKATGEECEINLECMRVMLREEKALRRSISKNANVLLSLDCVVADETSEEWLTDKHNFVDDIIASDIENAFISFLSHEQKAIYLGCMKRGLTQREYSKLSGLPKTTLQNQIVAIRKIFEKKFM